MFEITIEVNHCKMADLAITHGVLVLLTGIILIIVRRVQLHPNILRYLRLVHVVLGMLTSIYGLLTYLVAP